MLSGGDEVEGARWEESGGGGEGEGYRDSNILVF